MVCHLLRMHLIINVKPNPIASELILLKMAKASNYVKCIYYFKALWRSLPKLITYAISILIQHSRIFNVMLTQAKRLHSLSNIHETGFKI